MAVIDTGKFDIVAITESWLYFEDRDSTSEFNIRGYNLFHSSRQSREGGGVIVFMKNDLIVRNREDIKLTKSTETVWTEISSGSDSNNSLVLGVVYRPGSQHVNTNKELWAEIKRAT